MKRIAFLITALLLPLLMFGQTAEECYKKGAEYNDNKDYGKAMEWYLKAANQGHAQAQNNIGALYANGYGVEKNQTKAIEWYLKAANQGNIYAQKNLGYIYLKGNGVQQDEDKAIEWYTKAALQGNSDAQFRLGAIYNDRKDYNNAAKWYQKAADQDNASAQINLGALYNNGQGVPQDFKKAVEWYQKSAYQGNAYGQNNLGWMYEKGRGVPQDFVKAAEWYQRAANKGHKTAAKNLKRIKEFLPANMQSSGQTQIQASGTSTNQKKTRIDGVDTEIPVINRVNKSTFAIIIANEDYQQETKVDYAKNDGEVFRDYCHKTLGLPEKNVHFVANATRNNIVGELYWLSEVCKAFKGEASVIFYYAGHGLPDEDSGSAYLLPVDGNSQLLPTCYSINELYETLGKLPAKKVTVLMDACFSGAKRNGGMLASARGVAIKAKPSDPKGNSMVVLSAAQGNETAYKYDEAKHGLFTYFLLKKLKDSKGNVTMGELSRYIQDQVGRYSIVENGKSQTPTVEVSNAIKGTWENYTF